MTEIREVKSRQALEQFIRFADQLYEGSPYRVTPLHQIERSTLSREKNPAFDYCEASYWLAYQDNKIVGRVAAMVNHKANAIWQQNHVRFGWLDFVDDPNVSAALIKTVENWAQQKGFDTVHGPMGFTDMDLEGMLVEGFKEVGTQAVLYNYPYYPVHLEKLGYSKAADWIQFEIKVPEAVPEKITRIAEIVKQKYGFRILKAKNAKDLLPYAGKMFDTLNESFKDLYGFVPLSERQKAYYTKQYFSLIDPRYVCFVIDRNDEVAGFGLSVASLSKALIKAKGKVFPFGFIHILKALRKNNTVDMLLQGVKPKYRNKGLPSIFFAELMQAYIDNGVEYTISSHALETNTAAFLTFQDFSHRQHLRRRCYEKKLEHALH